MDRVLSRRALNRALLARQLLLERSSAPPARAVERVGGIQAQYAPSMYFGLWSRLEALDPAAITRGLERRTLVQATLMRSTIHLVSRGDYWPLALAVGDVGAPARRPLRRGRGLARAAGDDGRRGPRAARDALPAGVRAGGPRRRGQLHRVQPE
jgi:Winged helix DNA-binding domain